MTRLTEAGPAQEIPAGVAGYLQDFQYSWVASAGVNDPSQACSVPFEQCVATAYDRVWTTSRSGSGPRVAGLAVADFVEADPRR